MVNHGTEHSERFEMGIPKDSKWVFRKIRNGYFERFGTASFIREKNDKTGHFERFGMGIPKDSEPLVLFWKKRNNNNNNNNNNSNCIILVTKTP